MQGIVDIHCHLIPDVDDGVQTFEECRKLLEMEYAQGVRKIIATPHFRRAMFECPLDKIQKQYEEVVTIAKEIGTKDDGIEVILGCEYYADSEMIDELNNKTRSTIGNTKFVLVEFAENEVFSYMRERIYQLVCNGYEPIIAHAERYITLLKKKEYIDELVHLGARIQLNARSIIGLNGWRVKAFCKKIMKADYLYAVGSDAHDTNRRPPHMECCAVYLKKKMGYAYAHKVMVENPQRLLRKIKKENWRNGRKKNK